jgi:peptidoglycan-N-acetylglucosamine deacetylase
MLRGVAVVVIFALAGGASVTPPSCLDSGGYCNGTGSYSCIYCPEQCGTCDSIGVIDHCVDPGTVHLSIDDGPTDWTDEALNVLAAHRINASFWLIGREVSKYQTTVQRIARDGHFIGTHSYAHDNANSLMAEELRADLVMGQIVFAAALQNYTSALSTVRRFYRPPFGNLNDPQRRLVVSDGYTVVVWNLDLYDWYGDITVVRQRLEEYLSQHNPATSSFILVLHMASKRVVCAFPAIIETVRAWGYRFVDAPECFHGSGSISRPGVSAVIDACHHLPQSCIFSTFGAKCSLNVTCCEPGACCTPEGRCVKSEEACGLGCVNGNCKRCQTGARAAAGGAVDWGAVEACWRSGEGPASETDIPLLQESVAGVPAWGWFVIALAATSMLIVAIAYWTDAHRRAADKDRASTAALVRNAQVAVRDARIHV